jgi:hypothetical protein
MKGKILVVCLSLSVLTWVGTGVLQAGEKEDMEAMQKQLNQNVLDRPFNSGDKASIMAYLEQALQKGTLPPQLHPPNGWQPGWTCNNLMYSYGQYRNCLHYQQYYGHYYGY